MNYFGLFEIVGKSADFLGPLIISACGFLFQNVRYGILGLIVLFSIGYVLVRTSEKYAHAESAKKMIFWT